jgi:hypothetical protein
MQFRFPVCAIVVASVLAAAIGGARAHDEKKYPDLRGQWRRVGSAEWTPAGQKPPLTPEYQAIYDAGLKDQLTGGHGTEPSYMCLPPGMPRAMLAYTQMEVVVTQDTTYILIDHINDNRRIFTDGRDWPANLEPTYLGYSIGRWIDEDGDGRYDVLEVETRGPFGGPRAYDHTGLPLHFDGQSIFKERFYLDKSDPSLLHDEITVIDHALTRPWSVDKTIRRNPNLRPVWPESNCVAGNINVLIGKDNYWLSADGLLMPARRNQAPPDLRYFRQAQTPN